MEWINIEDYVPKKECELLLTDGKEVVKGHYEPSPDGGDFSVSDWEYSEWLKEKLEITHWMRLPPSPKGEE